VCIIVHNHYHGRLPDKTKQENETEGCPNFFFKKTNMGIICALSSFRDEHAAEWPWFTFYIRILNRIVFIIVSYLQIGYYKTVPRAYNRFYPSGAALRHSPPWSLSLHFGRENFTDMPKYGVCVIVHNHYRGCLPDKTKQEHEMKGCPKKIQKKHGDHMRPL
jgi:hypothetical protein